MKRRLDLAQLRLFESPADGPGLDHVLHQQAEIQRLVGTNDEWLAKTLSDVLALWDDLVTQFYLPYEAELKPEAKTGKEERRLIRERQAMYLHLIEAPFIERMQFIEEQVMSRARSLGVAEDELLVANELLSEFFRHPLPAELSLPLSTCVERLAEELAD
ncbi:hypothetical protein FAES_4052 [Fibrella aestuarina BUZ 2]|uniref:Uncharacterized protein n=1 Tax=Fibrella aestuarina BUZ 2 TaxID=1166018 RepID=I0KD49_9BACT|nr:hypothetical protein [Fibrella aestuarina]CCH02052.1 hypothetical protein FAES_4052 [Fibrella aestuarina BUZ 2]